MAAQDTGRQAVLVTGGAGGIGAGIVRAFAAAGAHVAFTHLHTPPAETLAAVAGLPGTAFPILADLTSEVQADAAVAQAVDRLGALDVLVANAGGMVAKARCTEMTLELWNRIFAVNATATFLTCRAALRRMEVQGSGSIVILSSLAAHNGGAPGATAYAAAKGAMLTYTRGLAKEVGPLGIRVNGVAPGIISGRLHDSFTMDESRRNSVANTPLRREGTDADVAAAVMFLASPGSAFLAGETIEVNGGYGLY